MSAIYSIPEPRLDPPEPVIVGRCQFCAEDIQKGDEIVEFGGLAYHRECFEDVAFSILVEKFGARICVAEEDDGYDG